jgi:AcrR family transcriptional regulator
MCAASTSSAEPSSRPPVLGRPRSQSADEAILRAALDVLGRDGYQSMSMQSVANVAGVGKPTLYRRFASKADLVAAALVQITAGPEPPLPTGTSAALRVLLAAAAGALATPGAMVILGSLIAERRADPALVAAFNARVFGPRRAVVIKILETGISAGEVEAAADLALVSDLLFGAILGRAALGEELNDDELDRIVDTVMRGITPRPTS